MSNVERGTTGALPPRQTLHVTFEMGRIIAGARIVLSLGAFCALAVDSLEPSRAWRLGDWNVAADASLARALVWHLTYALTLYGAHARGRFPKELFERAESWGDGLFAVAVASITLATSTIFYAFFLFAVLTTAMRRGFRPAMAVTGASSCACALLSLRFGPRTAPVFAVVRGAGVAVGGVLVGSLAQAYADHGSRLRSLESRAQREQIARMLHDGHAQALAAISWRLDACLELLRLDPKADFAAELATLRSGIEHEQDDLRRTIGSLIDREAALAASGDARGSTQVVVQADFRGSASFVEHVLMILLEGTRNVRRHAGASSAVLRARSAAGELSVSIDDDGVGFAPGAAPPWSILSRVSECGGRLILGAEAPRGAHVRIHLPEG